MILHELYDQQNYKSLIKLIKLKCTTSLQAYQTTGKVLYRGVASDFTKVKLASSPTNRQPQATHFTISKLIDNHLSSMGYSALRSNSIYATSSQQEATSYSYSYAHDAFHGSVYVIFPLNGFSFTWSSKLRDLTRDLKLANKGVNSVQSGDWSWLNRMAQGLSGTSLATQQKYNAELRARIIDGYNNVTSMTAQQFVQRYDFSHSDFAGAVASRNEVLIHGKYLAVDLSVFDQIKSLLGL